MKNTLKIDPNILIQKRNNCIKNLDKNKTCVTCKHKDIKFGVEPCDECFDEVLGMPVNPTKWEAL